MTRRELDISASRQLGMHFGTEVLERASRYEAVNDVFEDWCRETECLWMEQAINVVANQWQYPWPDNLLDIKHVYYRVGSSAIDDRELRYETYEKFSRRQQGAVPGVPSTWSTRGMVASATVASPYVLPLLISPYPTVSITGGLFLLGPGLFPRMTEVSNETPIEEGAAGGEALLETAANDILLPWLRSHRKGLIHGIALQYAIKDADNPASNARIPYLEATYLEERDKAKEAVANPDNEPIVVGGDYFRSRFAGTDMIEDLLPGYSVLPYRG